MARKKSLGRRKIEMKLIPSKQARQVAFSKRRFGLFKKANELCTLTGCEIALVVFSPSGKAFSFGHPSVDTTVRRYLGQSPMLAAVDPDPQGPNASARNHQYVDVRKQLVLEKKHGKELEEKGKKCQKPHWFDTPLHELSLDLMVKSKECMEELKDQVAQKVDELSAGGSALTLAPATFVGAIDLNVAPPEEI